MKDLPYDTVDSDRPAADLYLRHKNEDVKFKELSGDNGENALKNWSSKMDDRKHTQHTISSK